VAQKNGTIILYALTLPNINRFSKLFHYQNLEKICNNTITKDPTTPKCVATLPCEMSGVLKATIENKMTSVTTHFKKLTTGNNVFIVSVTLDSNYHLPVITGIRFFILIFRNFYMFNAFSVLTLLVGRQ